MKKIRIPKYNLAEEIINSISHGIGEVLNIAALVLCLIKAKNTIGIVSCLLYRSLIISPIIVICNLVLGGTI